MRSAPRPRAHLFVCENRREGSPLGPGCGPRGEAVFDALKRAVGEQGLTVDVWVTRTRCLGVCPAVGTAVAIYPRGGLLTEVLAADTAALLRRAREENP